MWNSADDAIVFHYLIDVVKDDLQRFGSFRIF